MKIYCNKNYMNDCLMALNLFVSRSTLLLPFGIPELPMSLLLRPLLNKIKARTQHYDTATVDLIILWLLIDYTGR
jgi:hypothetical protein